MLLTFFAWGVATRIIILYIYICSWYLNFVQCGKLYFCVIELCAQYEYFIIIITIVQSPWWFVLKCHFNLTLTCCQSSHTCLTWTTFWQTSIPYTRSGVPISAVLHPMEAFCSLLTTSMWVGVGFCVNELSGTRCQWPWLSLVDLCLSPLQLGIYMNLLSVGSEFPQFWQSEKHWHFERPFLKILVFVCEQKWRKKCGKWAFWISKVWNFSESLKKNNNLKQKKQDKRWCPKQITIIEEKQQST